MSNPVVAWRETTEELLEQDLAQRQVERRKRLQARRLVRRGDERSGPRLGQG